MAHHDPGEQRAFYRRRMNEELDRADYAADEGLRALHTSWAGEYRRRLDDLSGASAPRRRPAAARGLGSWTTDLG